MQVTLIVNGISYVFQPLKVCENPHIGQFGLATVLSVSLNGITAIKGKIMAARHSDKFRREGFWELLGSRGMFHYGPYSFLKLANLRQDYGQVYGQVFLSKLLVYNDFNGLSDFPNESAWLHQTVKDVEARSLQRPFCLDMSVG